MTDWTKGYWYLKEPGESNGIELDVIPIMAPDFENDDDWHIAAIWQDAPNAESNAHLIAAAPDLYEALAMVEPIIDEMAGTLEPGRKIRNALAKARGDQK